MSDEDLTIFTPQAILESIASQEATLPGDWAPAPRPRVTSPEVYGPLLDAFDETVTWVAWGWEQALERRPDLAGTFGSTYEAAISGIPLGIRLGHLLVLWSLNQADDEPSLKSFDSLRERRLVPFFDGDFALSTVSQLAATPAAAKQIFSILSVAGYGTARHVPAAASLVEQVLTVADNPRSAAAARSRFVKASSEDLADSQMAVEDRLPDSYAQWGPYLDLARSWDHRGPLAEAIADAREAVYASPYASNDALALLLTGLHGAVMSALAQDPGSAASWVLMHDAAPLIGLDVTACWSARSLRQFAIDLDLHSLLGVAALTGQNDVPPDVVSRMLDGFIRACSTVVTHSESRVVAGDALRLGTALLMTRDILLS